MWPLSASAQHAITTSRSMTVRGTAYTAALGTVADLPISGGSVVVDATSQVRRTATVLIADPLLWPANPLDVLSPLGSELQLDYGIVIPGVGVEWVPLGRFVISKAARIRPSGRSDPVTLTLQDRSVKVAEDRFDSGTQVGGGATTAVAAITALIQATLPTATVRDLTGSTTVAPLLDIERERWADGVEKLADAIAAEVFADPLGDFVIRPQPTLNDPIDWVVAGGPGGVLISRSEEKTRELAFNRVVVSGSRSDGTAPVWAAVSDTDPASPTLYGGPFGRKPRFYTSPLITTAPQATATGTALLSRGQGMQGSVGLTALVNPALDAGDVLLVKDRTLRQVHIADRLTIPLGPTDPQDITTRSVDLPSEAG